MMTRQLRSRDGKRSATKWLPDVPLPDAVKVIKKPRLSASTKPKKPEPKPTAPPKGPLNRWALPCHRQKHSDRPHQDAVMAGMPELCSMITEYLTQQELTALIRVCQEWHHHWTGYLYRRVNLNKNTLSIGIGKLRFDLYGSVVESLSFTNCEDQDVIKVFQHDFPKLREVDLASHVFASPKVLKATLRSISPSIRRLKFSCYASSYSAKNFSQEVWSLLSILHELFPGLEELVLNGYSHSSFGLLMLFLKNMSRLRVLRFTGYRGSYYSYRNQPVDKFAHLDFSGEDWKNTALETLDLSLVMVCFHPQRSGEDVPDTLHRLGTFFERIPKLRHLTIDCMDSRMTQEHWHNGVLRHLPNLETLSIQINNGDKFNVCAKLPDYCPRLTSVRLHKNLQRFGTPTNSLIEHLPPNLQHLSISNLLIDEDELKSFVERSTPRARTITDGAAAGSARLPILPSLSSSSHLPADTLCHALQRLNLEHCRGVTPTAMLHVLDRCPQIECLNIIGTRAGTLELFEEGRPWACAKTLKALSMDLVRVKANSPATNTTATTTPGGQSAALATYETFFHNTDLGAENQQYNQGNATTFEPFTVHDLRRIRQRLISLENLRALRLKGSLSRLTVISRGDYKPRDELYTLKPRERSNEDGEAGGDGHHHHLQGEGSTNAMAIDGEDQLDMDENESDEDEDELDAELRKQRQASILERLEWAKIDVEMYDIFAERARLQSSNENAGVTAATAAGAGAAVAVPAELGHHRPFHQQQSPLQNEIARLERWQDHHHDLEDVWYDYTVPRNSQGTEVFHFRKTSPTGWMAANLASKRPFPL